MVPVCDGGTDDPINIVTSCWECNSGKAGVPLDDIAVAEDPHDRAVLLLERERQLREYNAVLQRARLQRDEQAQELVDYWCENVGISYMPQRDCTWLQGKLETVPAEMIRRAMRFAINRGATNGLRYVVACLRNWKDRGEM